MDAFDAIGVKVGTVFAGTIGGILSLSMLPKLTFRKAVTAVLGGGACAGYLTPLVVEYFAIGSRNLENALAFIVGVVGMNVVGGLFLMSDRWRQDPSLDLDALKKGRGR